jgi:hypothetical protein
MKNPTHLITAWDGTRESEAPICGADTYDANVWSHRTEDRAFVTCERCLKASRKLDKPTPTDSEE